MMKTLDLETNAIRILIIVAVLGSILATSRRGAYGQQTIPAGIKKTALTANEEHVFPITLKKGDFVQVRVEQIGIDISLEIKTQENEILAQMDSPNGLEGTETLSFISERNQKLKLVIRGTGQQGAKGEYAVSDLKIRPVESGDSKRVAAESLFYSALLLANTDEYENDAMTTLGESVMAWDELGEEHLSRLASNVLNALSLLKEGMALSEGEPEANALIATAKLEKAGQAFSKMGNSTRSIQSFDKAAEIMTAYGRKENAISFIEKSFALKRQLLAGDELVSALLSLGATYDEGGYFPQALAAFQEAAELTFRDRDDDLRVQAEISCGLMNARLGNHRAANEWFNKALQFIEKSEEAGPIDLLNEMHKVVGEKLPAPAYSLIRPRVLSQVARALRNKAVDLDEENTMSSKSEAAEHYLMAAKLFEEAGDSVSRAKSLTNLGYVYSQLGLKNSAVQSFNQAIAIYDQLDQPVGLSNALNGLGNTLQDLGEMQKALESHLRSLQIRRQMRDPNLAANSLINLGRLLDELGQTERALEAYYEALYQHEQSNDRNGISAALHNIGLMYLKKRDYKKALKYLYRSYDYLANDDYEGIASTLHNLGTTYRRMGKAPQALWFFRKTLEFERKGLNEEGAAITLSSIALIYFDEDEPDEALNSFHESLSIFGRVRYPRGEAGTFSQMMSFWRQYDRLGLAVFFGKQSVNLYQELRQNISGLEKETQKTYLKSIEPTYRKLADILINEGRIAEAEQVLGMLKEEEYYSYLRRDDKVAADLKGRISLSPLEKQAFEDYEKYAGEITRTAAEFSALEKKKNSLGLGKSLEPTEQKQYDDLKAKYDAAVTVFGKFLDDLKVKFSANDVRVAAVDSDTQGILKRLNQPRTVIISTIVGEDRLNLIVTTADIQKAHTVEIRAADVNKLVTEFRDAVKNPKIDPRPLGEKLYDVLFPEALRKDLENIKADTIVWSLDGTLRYVPMAALWDGERYLVERYTNAVLTLASRDKLGLAATAAQKRLVLGVGVSKPFETFNALPAVPRELCGVVDDPAKKAFCNSLGARAGVIKGLMLADDEFTLAGFENNLGKTPYVHIASHFALNPGNETDSYLLLGGGTERRFSLDKLKKTRLDGIELLTLSACNTAMASGANSSGVEVEGFGALAQKQGARTILATLWAVADDSTKDLMTDFYARLGNKNAPGKAAALRQSQLAMLSGSYKTTGEQPRRTVVVEADGKTTQPKYETDPKAPFAHPFFWSPFVIMGNWQ